VPSSPPLVQKSQPLIRLSLRVDLHRHHGGPFQSRRRQLLRPPSTARRFVQAAAAFSYRRRHLRRFSEVNKIGNLSFSLFDSSNEIFQKFELFLTHVEIKKIFFSVFDYFLRDQVLDSSWQAN